MRLYSAPRAPSPRRVTLFMGEKAITDIEVLELHLLQGEQRHQDFRDRNPLARVPALELDDGRVLTESRAICTYLEGQYPEPNLMGRTTEDSAFIEMWDRRIEWHLLFPASMWGKHSLPMLAAVEQPQLPDYAKVQEGRFREFATWLNTELATRPFISGERFTIADITAFVTLEFARHLHFIPGESGLLHLQRWLDAVAGRRAFGR